MFAQPKKSVEEAESEHLRRCARVVTCYIVSQHLSDRFLNAIQKFLKGKNKWQVYPLIFARHFYRPFQSGTTMFQAHVHFPEDFDAAIFTPPSCLDTHASVKSVFFDLLVVPFFCLWAPPSCFLRISESFLKLEIVYNALAPLRLAQALLPFSKLLARVLCPGMPYSLCDGSWLVLSIFGKCFVPSTIVRLQIQQ